jgi:hypothetical protein
VGEPTWEETVMAGKLFALLMDASPAATDEVEAMTISKGVIRLDMVDGRTFDVLVKAVR